MLSGLKGRRLCSLRIDAAAITADAAPHSSPAASPAPLPEAMCVQKRVQRSAMHVCARIHMHMSTACAHSDKT